MPLTSDSRTLDIASKLVSTLREGAGTPKAFRPAHAKGQLVKGTFKPTAEAASLSKAPHFNNASTPFVTRFSVSTGLPTISDKDEKAGPRGLAIRFLLSEDGHQHTDIIGHSTAHFPVATGEGFLALLHASANGVFDEFLKGSAAADAFFKIPIPHPESFLTEQWFMTNAFKFVNADGQEKYGRYRVVPERYLTLSEEALKGKSNSYLFEDLEERLGKGPVTLKLVVQIAEEGDVTDDATMRWPDSRELVELGSLVLETFVQTDESQKEQQRIIFDPIPRVDGIEPSADPILEMRAAVYLISGRVRREAQKSM
ncbi:hypothetical protein CERZMDRAFT_36679 [Cercospora zeae-maydis SCOH1-5]|uniref:Catalase core domain-containing protein n=1 Tax=Cercospora zeae-maydis SCOH1-5 TaxID=717836 RepID=A0A6A6FMV0_9PEZI|nr:hypothetical protein CERZMDRAFT_36679 [Cercospora zeae-maydis SCOH1-5]